MGKIVPSILILLMSDFLLVLSGCKNNIESPPKNRNEERYELTNNETEPLFVKFRSFQNPDSTWGYTVIVNSRPYLHYSRIPYKNTGFSTKHEADFVAGILVKMIQKGDLSPKLNKKLIDSIQSEMKYARKN
jgi:hypothetical protein